MSTDLSPLIAALQQQTQLLANLAKNAAQIGIFNGTQGQNTVYAGPSASAGSPSFRGLVTSDIQAAGDSRYAQPSQLHHGTPFSANSSIASVNSISTTTSSFTAPSTGILVIFFDGQSSANTSAYVASSSLTASLGAVSVGGLAAGYTVAQLGTISMNSGQSTTVTGSFTLNAGQNATVVVALRCFFLPIV